MPALTQRALARRYISFRGGCYTNTLKLAPVVRCMSSQNTFNFSPASGQVLSSPQATKLATHKWTRHKEWVAYMKAQGVTRVINLLDSAKEIQKGYSCDLPAIMTQEFTEFHNISVSTPGGVEKVVKVMEDAAGAKEKVVVHCWQGQGRTGLALAAWLVLHHNMSPEEAAQKVVQAAEVVDAGRKVSVEKLQAALPQTKP